MPAAICTISTQSHLFKVKALYQSLADKTEADFFCLVTDSSTNDPFERIKFITFNEIPSEPLTKIRKKYKGNKLRWACKPIMIQHLIQHGYDKVIYVDNDMFFYESPDFLFNMLDENNILLTPHFYPANPTKEQIWLEANFRVGLFNGGFIGANQKSISAMNWWTECCLYNVKKSYWRGLFDDQKYLDLFPILFDKVQILKHKGCNVAGWNIETSPRSINEKNEVVLDEKWQMIFVHYNYYTMECITKGNDPILKPKLGGYFSTLKSFHPKYQYSSEIKDLKYKIIQYFVYIRFRIARMLD